MELIITQENPPFEKTEPKDRTFIAKELEGENIKIISEATELGKDGSRFISLKLGKESEEAVNKIIQNRLTLFTEILGPISWEVIQSERSETEVS